MNQERNLDILARKNDQVQGYLSGLLRWQAEKLRWGGKIFFLRKRVVDAFHFWHILPGIPLGEPGEPVRPEGFSAEPGGEMVGTVFGIFIRE